MILKNDKSIWLMLGCKAHTKKILAILKLMHNNKCNVSRKSILYLLPVFFFEDDKVFMLKDATGLGHILVLEHLGYKDIIYLKSFYLSFSVIWSISEKLAICSSKVIICSTISAWLVARLLLNYKIIWIISYSKFI